MFDLQSTRTLGTRLSTKSEPSSEPSISATAANTTTFSHRFSGERINAKHSSTSPFSLSLNTVSNYSSQSL